MEDKVYGKKISERQLRQMIGYWIEVRHINSSIDHLVEDTDEIGKLYEHSLWTKDDQDGEDTFIMDVHVLLEAALDTSDDVLRIVEDGFSDILKMCKQYYPDLIFGDYANIIDDETLKLIEEDIRYYSIKFIILSIINEEGGSNASSPPSFLLEV